MDVENPDMVILLTAVIVIPLLVALIIGFFLTSWVTSRKVIASRNWQSVTGKIVKAATGSESMGEGANAVTAEIEYEYRVNGETFRSKRISFGVQWKTNNPKPAQEMLAKYPEGSPVEVFYDSANPASAVLERYAPVNRLYWMLTGLFVGLLVLIGGMLVVFSTSPLFNKTPA
jgi:hypothetical protein